MAGRGPAPKDPSKRARRNADPVPHRVIEVTPSPQPQLPDVSFPRLTEDGDTVWETFVWPEITREWWAMWAAHPLAAEFTPTDWSELRDTALLHARFWTGETRLASELRLRVAKFGATPEDRARLRISFAVAEHAENKRGPRRRSSAELYQGLDLVTRD